MPYLLAGVSLYGIIYLGEFVINVPLVDGEIPTFYNYASFQSSGSSLTSISGSGNMTGSSLTVYVTSTSAWTPAPGVPTLTANPGNRSAIAGANTSFSVSAIGNPDPTYQWQRLAFRYGVWTNLSNAGAYSGVITPTLNVSGINSGMSGDQFRCVVSNAYGPVTSVAATLTVLVPPVITSQPASQTVLRGSNVTFTVLVTGDAPLRYQWRKGAANVIGHEFLLHHQQCANEPRRQLFGDGFQLEWRRNQFQRRVGGAVPFRILVASSKRSRIFCFHSTLRRAAPMCCKFRPIC